jgi:import inner membrane translocase subunit TIM23
MNSDDHSDAGAPLPDFRAAGIQLQTVAPAMGVLTPSINNTPDYLDYDTKGRGIVVTMFSNAGVSYLLGVSTGGLYGFYQGVKSTPSTRFRVQLNSILNHCGRYGSRAGNTIGVFSVLYSLYEGLADQVSRLLSATSVESR